MHALIAPDGENFASPTVPLTAWYALVSNFATMPTD